MANAKGKRVNRIVEVKGFRVEKAGHGKGHGRFYIMNLAEGGRMRSGILDHEYSFSLEEAEAWLATHSKWPCISCTLTEGPSSIIPPPRAFALGSPPPPPPTRPGTRPRPP